MRKREKCSEDELRRTAEKRDAQKEREAEYRRKLLKELSPATAEYARREFAKLGLTQ
jgi:hypothetical protein